MFKKIVSLILSISLIITQPIFAQGLAQLNLAQYLGQARPMATDSFRPTQLRYFSYNNLNNSFRILLDKGDTKDIKDSQLKEQAKELMDYFLIGVTLPNDAFWVNLRPDSPDNIINPELEQTSLGKILLEADLQLKKDTASRTSPQTPEGKAYWDKLYKKAGELFGTENITIPTLTRPWIVPGEIIVREGQDSAYIYKATLKVMLEEDYLKSPSHKVTKSPANLEQYSFKDVRLQELNEYSTQLIKELIIPKLTQEVNSSQRYVKLRQVYYSLVLSRWFKMRFTGKSGQYADLIDRHDLTNLTAQEPYDKLTYFKQYQESFAQGEYNLKEPVYTPYGQSIRSYMSGGFDGTNMTIEGINTPETAGSSIIEKRFKNGNTVFLEGSAANILQINTNNALVKQPLAIAASPVSTGLSLIENKILAPNLLTVKKFIELYLLTSSIDKKHLENILEACKNYMLSFPGNYAKLAGSKINEQKITNIKGQLSMYFGLSNKINIAVAAGYLSRVMQDEFNEETLSEDFEDLQKEINNIVEQLHKDSIAWQTVEGVIQDAEKEMDRFLSRLSDREILLALNPQRQEINQGQRIKDEFAKLAGATSVSALLARIGTLVKNLNKIKKSYIESLVADPPDRDGISLSYTFMVMNLLTLLAENGWGVPDTNKTDLPEIPNGGLIVPPLTDGGYVVNDADREKISSIKGILNMFPGDGKKLIEQYLDFTELYEETEEKLKIYWKAEETYDIQKAAEATLGFYNAIADRIQPGESKPDIENKIKALRDTGNIINGVVEKLKSLIGGDIAEFRKIVNMEADPSELDELRRELSLKNSKATVTYILFLLSDIFKPYRGNIPGSFIEDSKTRYKVIETELEIFDFPIASSAMTVAEIKTEAKTAIINAGRNLQVYILSDEAQNKYNLNAEYIDKLGDSEVIKLWLWLENAIKFFNDRIKAGDLSAEVEARRTILIYKGLIEELKQHASATSQLIKEIYGTFKTRTAKSADDGEAILKALLAMGKEEKISKEELDIVLEILTPRRVDRVVPVWKIIKTLKEFSVGGIEKQETSSMQMAIFNVLIDDNYPGCAFFPKERLAHFLRYAETLVGSNYLDASTVSQIALAKENKTYGKALDLVMNLSKEKMGQASKEEVSKLERRQANVDIDNSIPTLSRIIEAYINNKDSLLSGEKKKIAKNVYAVSSALVNEIKQEEAVEVVGGIDFTDRAMRIGLEPMGSFADLKLVLPRISNVAAIDLDNEFKQIQAMALSGIRPSDSRILEFAAACYYRGEFSPRLGEITACLQQAHFLDERLGRESSKALRLATILPEVLYSYSLN